MNHQPARFVSIDLGELQERAHAMTEAGGFDSLSQLVQAALLTYEQGLAEQDDPLIDAWAMERMAAYDAGLMRTIPAEEAFARMDDHIVQRHRERDAT